MEKKEELLKIVEAILFASGKWLSLDEISSLSRVRNLDDVKGALLKLKEEYSVRGGAVFLENEDDLWKLHVVPECIPYIRRIVTRTELSKTVLETLAIIASKAPVLQSDVVRIRTNKAYDHLSLLEESGYISRKKHGRTKIINIAEKFFDYFDISRNDVSARFQKVKDLERDVREKELFIKQRQAELQVKSAELKLAEDDRKVQLSKDVELLSREIDDLKKKVSSLPVPDISSEMLGVLEVVDLGKTSEPVAGENSSQNADSSSGASEQSVQHSYSQQPTPDTSEGVVTETSVQDSGNEPPKKISVNKSGENSSDTELSEDSALSNVSVNKTVEPQFEKKAEKVAIVDNIIEEKHLTLAERLEVEALQKARQSESKTGAGIFSKGVPKEAEEIIDKKAKNILGGVEETGENSS